MKIQIDMPNRDNTEPRLDTGLMGALGREEPRIMTAEEVANAHRLIREEMHRQTEGAFNAAIPTPIETADTTNWDEIRPMPRARRVGTLTSVSDMAFFGGEQAVEQTPVPIREVHADERIDVGDAMQLLEASYRLTFDKKNIYKNVQTQVIVKEPDPVNDHEEVIVNYVELADILATNRIKELFGSNADASTHEEEYNEWYDTYSKVILENKRKTNV